MLPVEFSRFRFNCRAPQRRLRASYGKYHDVPADLADACLVYAAGQLRVGEILTLDRDFEIYRWGRAKPFHLLIALD